MACPMGAETRPHRGRGVSDRTDCELSPCLVCSSYEPPLGKQCPRHSSKDSHHLLCPREPSGQTDDSTYCFGLCVLWQLLILNGSTGSGSCRLPPEHSGASADQSPLAAVWGSLPLPPLGAWLAQGLG